MEFDLREFSKDRIEEFLTCLVGIVYNCIEIKKLSDDENISFTYELTGYEFEEYLNDMYYELYFYYTRHEPDYYLITEGLTGEDQEIKRMLELIRAFTSMTDPMDVKFTTKYPLVLINKIGPSEDDSRGSHNDDKLIPTREQQQVSESNEFTFRELCEAAYIVKTKKFDKWYEHFDLCYEPVIDEENELMSIKVYYNHGS